MDELMKLEQPAFASRLLAWYDVAARDLPWRKDKTPYRIWVSEIMLQQTRVDTVIPYYERFLSVFPTIESLAVASDEKLRKLWEGLGYYRRAKHMKEAAIQIMQRHGGVFPSEKEAIEALKGIGEYTSGAIRSIAFEQIAAAVDGNVLRVFARLTGEEGDLTEAAVKSRLTHRVKELLPKHRNGDFTQALMELGATVCLPNGLPKCEVCPFASQCVAKATNRIGSIPKKKDKAKRKIEEWTIFVLCSPDGRIHLNQRPHQGLLADLWEFDKERGVLDETQARGWLETRGIHFRTLKRLENRMHVFSHIEWHLSAYQVYVLSADVVRDGLWADRPRIDDDLSIPTAVRPYLDLLIVEVQSD
jgi:A/G-specific adenine glycosylase